MMQNNKIQIMDDMMRNLQRGDGISNLRALQQMRQMKQPQPQTMTYMAKGGFPDLSGDGRITQKDILMGRGVIEKRYGGLAGLPEIRAFGGFNPFKAVAKGVKNVGKGIASGVRDVGKGISGALGGDSGSLLKNIAIQVALNAFLPGAGTITSNPFGKFGLRFLTGYAGAGLSGGIPGLTKDPFDPSKITSGLTRATLGAVGENLKTGADTTPTETDVIKKDPPTAFDKKVGEFTQQVKDVYDAPVAGVGDLPPKLSSNLDPLTYGDVGKSALSGYAETEKQKQFDMAKKMEQDARGAAEALTNRMEAEQRSAAEFARLAMEDPVLYNYVYKYQDNPEAVVDIVKRMTMGADDLQTAQMFEPATFTTASGRKPGELAAAYGGGISTIINNALGQNKQFASGMVPNTVDPRSDGMSDSETMIITDKQGTKPKGIMKISEEEYVVSAPDMALLGNGSARAGAQKLDNFRKNLRQMAYGTTKHQPRVDSNKALQSLMRG
jgi:hypothetical protein